MSPTQQAESETARSFRHLAAPLRLFHGSDCLSSLQPELARLGASRAVIVCGNSLLADHESLDRIRDAAGPRCAGVVAGVAAHSPIPRVQQTAHDLERLQADAVIAVGGGSAIVTARAASILLAEKKDISLLCTGRAAGGELVSPRLQAPKLPQIVVPTTPTTAMVKAGSAVLDPDRNNRVALFDPKTRAQALFVDPAFLAKTPRALVISAALNTLGMAVEGLLSRKANALSDAHLIHACGLVQQHLLQFRQGAVPPLAAYGELVLGAILAGQGTDQSGVGVAIPLAHALSAKFHLDSGLANAILLPHVLRFNASVSKSGMQRVARALGADAAAAAEDAAGAAIQALLESLALPCQLRDVGVPRDALAELAAIASEDWFVRDNPRPIRSADELERLLAQAW